MNPIVSVFLVIVYLFVFFISVAVVCGVSVIAARKLTEDKKLSKGLMWLGLLGWVGLVVLCFIKKGEEAAPATGEQNISGEAQ